ncbi:MAG: 1-acyl-sn-glycerol-3-phosphate acyltransferase, partial [Spirochaetes bacterium]|nr:1-acyl-sn-glycerol-3-phosphate acyltransferase [Spirochaetota bacterium]
MEKSDFLLKLTKIALDTLFRLTNAQLRIKGEGNIPDQPILYVINHFTRMETFFLPYVIRNITRKDVFSLASSEFFGGGFGNVLQKLGAVPTNSPDRDRVFSSTLLKGDTSCLIFPEGQMIKDKRIIEKGKYMVYNSGIRRPPHTGAGIEALKAEFYREKLKYFHETNYHQGIDAYEEYFNIDSYSMLEKVLGYETNIVPVNIT